MSPDPFHPIYIFFSLPKKSINKSKFLWANRTVLPKKSLPETVRPGFPLSQLFALQANN